MRSKKFSLIKEAIAADKRSDKSICVFQEIKSPNDLIKHLFSDGSEGQHTWFSGVITNRVIGFPDFYEITYDSDQTSWILNQSLDIADNC